MALITLALPISVKADDSNKTYDLQQTYNTQQQAKYDELQWSYQLVAYAKTLEGKRGGQCVVFARWLTGADRSKISGMAKTMQTNSRIARVGAIVKTKESKVGHVAVVIAISQNQILVVESNYHWNQKISTRWINIDSPKISGYLVL